MPAGDGDLGQVIWLFLTISNLERLHRVVLDNKLSSSIITNNPMHTDEERVSMISEHF